MATLARKDAEGKVARQQLQDALEATDAELQALGIQMNQIYAGSPGTCVADEDVPPSLDSVDLLKEVVVSTFPGYHLPHVWLAASGQSPRISTLDLCGAGSFTILTGLGGDCWINAAKEVSGTFSAAGCQIRAFSIGFRCDYMDCYRDWQRVRGVEEEGVVLVRPDHFVAWRLPRASADASGLLRGALKQVLSLN